MSDRRNPSSTYLSFIVRLWQADSEGVIWRATLEEIDPAGGRHHFSDLDALFGFLVAATRANQAQ